MGNGYYDDKDVQRQAICSKCKSFVTHDKVDDKVLACPLCGYRVDSKPQSRVAKLTARAFAIIVAAQVKARAADKK